MHFFFLNDGAGSLTYKNRGNAVLFAVFIFVFLSPWVCLSTGFALLSVYSKAIVWARYTRAPQVTTLRRKNGTPSCRSLRSRSVKIERASSRHYRYARGYSPKDYGQALCEFTPPPNEKCGGYNTEINERTEERERLALRNKVKGEKHLEIHGGLREDIGMKTYLHDPMDYAKKLKLRFRVAGLDLPERRKRYTVVGRRRTWLQIRARRSTTIDRKTHIVGEGEIYQEERDALEEEMRKLGVCDIEEFGRLASIEKTIDIPGGRWWPQTAKKDGDGMSKQFPCIMWKKRNERSNVGGVSIRSKNGAPSPKGCMVNGQMTTASNK